MACPHCCFDVGWPCAGLVCMVVLAHQTGLRGSSGCVDRRGGQRRRQTNLRGSTGCVERDGGRRRRQASLCGSSGRVERGHGRRRGQMGLRGLSRCAEREGRVVKLMKTPDEPSWLVWMCGKGGQVTKTPDEPPWLIWMCGDEARATMCGEEGACGGPCALFVFRGP